MTVPIPDGSTVDLTIDIKKETTIEEINNLLKNYSENDLKNIIGITYDPIVSSDVVRSTFSGLIDGLATMGINNKKIKLIISHNIIFEISRSSIKIQIKYEER